MDKIDDEKILRNERARLYYHRRKQDPEFVKYTNERVKNLALQKRHALIGPKKKIGRPKKDLTDLVPKEPKRRGRPLQYSINI